MVYSGKRSNIGSAVSAYVIWINASVTATKKNAAVKIAGATSEYY